MQTTARSSTRRRFSSKTVGPFNGANSRDADPLSYAEQSRNVYVSDGYKESTDGATYVYRVRQASGRLRLPRRTDLEPLAPAQSFCYKQYHYLEHTQTTFGDSGAGAIVDGGIGNAFRNKKVDSNGISADDGTLQRLRNDKELSGDGASHNL